MTDLLLTIPIYAVPALICWVVTHRELVGPAARRPLLKEPGAYMGVLTVSLIPIINIAVAAALIVKMIERYEFERSAN